MNYSYGSLCNLGGVNRLLRHTHIFVLLIAISLTLGGCQAFGEPESPPVNPTADIAQLLRVADTSLAAGNVTNAENVYRRAAEQDPNAPEPLIGLARSKAATGAHADAVHRYREALTLTPNHPEALRGLGASLIALGDTTEALVTYDSLIAANPDDYRARNGRGIALDLMKQHDAAQESYRAGLRIARDNVSLRNNLGLSLALSGRSQEAVGLLTAVANGPGATARNRQNLALALGLAGDDDAAQRVASVDLEPEQVETNLAYYADVRRHLEDARPTLPAMKEPMAPPVMRAVESRPPPTPRNADEVTTGEAIADHSVADAAPRRITPILQELQSPSSLTNIDTLDQPGTAVAMAPNAETDQMRRDSATLPADIPPVPPTSLLRASATVSDVGLVERRKSVPSAYRIQIASTQSEKRAVAIWNKLQNKAPGLLGDLKPVIVRADLGKGKGILFYRVRTNLLQRDEAERRCAGLKGRGLDCFVAKAENATDPVTSSTAEGGRDKALPLPPRRRDVVLQDRPVNPVQRVSASAQSAPGIVPAVDTRPGTADEEAKGPQVPDASATTAGGAQLAETNFDASGTVAAHPKPVQTDAEKPTARAEAEPASQEHAVAGKQPAPTSGNYSVQIASSRSEAGAQKAWSKVQQKAPDLLGDLRHVISRADLGSAKGVYYRARSGTLERNEALRRCEALKSRGLDCFVVRVGTTGQPAPEDPAGNGPSPTDAERASGEGV
jgi:Flp pilus assembly protein TadD